MRDLWSKQRGDQEALRRTFEVDGSDQEAKDQVRKFSGGMQRRLSIAMALVSDPQVLFLDEPTLGLDPQARRSMWEQIEELKSKKTILLTTHYLEETDALADRIAIIDGGKIIALGTSQELKDRVYDTQVMEVKAKNLTSDVVEGLKKRYSEVRPIENGVEIMDKELSFDEVVDHLRYEGVSIYSASLKQPTLGDVFLKLRGRS
jgi:ABC-2 type transport system ATP-binding protein